MLNWISSGCIMLAGQAGPLYVNTTISMGSAHFYITIGAQSYDITHLSDILTAYSLYSVVLCLPQHPMHHVLVLTAHRQFTLSLFLLLEENKSLLFV